MRGALATASRLQFDHRVDFHRRGARPGRRRRRGCLPAVPDSLMNRSEVVLGPLIRLGPSGRSTFSLKGRRGACGSSALSYSSPVVEAAMHADGD